MQEQNRKQDKQSNTKHFTREDLHNAYRMLYRDPEAVHDDPIDIAELVLTLSLDTLIEHALLNITDLIILMDHLHEVLSEFYSLTQVKVVASSTAVTHELDVHMIGGTSATQGIMFHKISNDLKDLAAKCGLVLGGPFNVQATFNQPQ